LSSDISIVPIYVGSAD